MPGSPLPLNRILPPSVTPAGICTVTGLLRTTWPLPLQVGHGVSTIFPVPPQRGQGRENEKRP